MFYRDLETGERSKRETRSSQFPMLLLNVPNGRVTQGQQVNSQESLTKTNTNNIQWSIQIYMHVIFITADCSTEVEFNQTKNQSDNHTHLILISIFWSNIYYQYIFVPLYLKMNTFFNSVNMADKFLLCFQLIC